MLRFSVQTLILLAVALPAVAAPRAVQGITEPFMDVTLSSSVQGTVYRILFKEGAEVAQGQVIMELDSKLEELEIQRRREVMARSGADYEATKQLFDRSKAVSKDELDKRYMEYKVAGAEYGIAEEQLRRRKIVAPFAGIIVELYLQPGAGCEPYQSLVRLVDTKQCYFTGHIEGVSGADLQLNQAVSMEVAGSRERVDGVLIFIAPIVDSASGLAKVKALFPNAESRIRPGLAAKIFIP